MTHSVPPQIQQIFDPKWYLATYQDVAQAGKDPFEHFVNFGWMEGRWPCAIEAVQLDDDMWANKSPHEAERRLKEISEQDESFEKGLASWFICRWLGSWGKWEEAKNYVTDLFENSDLCHYIKHEGPFLLAFTILLKCGEKAKAEELLANPQWQDSANKTLAAAMLQNSENRLRTINTIFSHRGLLPIEETESVTLDFISSNSAARVLKLGKLSPLVTVIIPCFNAEKTISTALNSLSKQTYGKLEVIVVDDCSTDDSASIIKALASQDKRIRYVRLEQNSGAYAARNKGLELSKGKLITTHDADDWSHPQKIELQVSEIRKSRKVKAVVSHWVRTTPELEFERWRMEEGWIYRNVSSLMFRRSVFRKLGYWDTVSVNADTEYYLRILKKYGSSAIKEVLPGLPLSFGRVDEGSLTLTSATHLRTQFSGIRKDYIDAAVSWHNRTRRLYMPKKGLRKFVAPPYICRGSSEVRKENLKHVLETKGLFDKAWYLTAYPDIAEAGVNPLKHFINHGVIEGRDPAPYISLSGLAFISNESTFNALSRWASGSDDGSNLLSISGNAVKDGSVRILMVAHLAGKELYGAERSFIDCIKMLSEKKVDISVVLPTALNHQYILEIAKYVRKIFFTPLPWWRDGRQEIDAVTKKICDIIHQSDVSLVYVNTLTLWEPLIAARKCNKKSVIHVRELPNHDEDLCRRLHSSPEHIRKHVDGNTDLVIANSECTANFIALKDKCTVVYNAIDSQKFTFQAPESSKILKVVMLSSNTTKKGIDDFFKVAEAVGNKSEQINFFLFGPETSELKTRLQSYQLPNVNYSGYAKEPLDAFKGMDIVLNLSRFQESFGRTIVEGMASGCVPIGYDWGALAEIIDPAIGYLAPLGDHDSVAGNILALSENRETLASRKLAGQKLAMDRFGSDRIAKQLIDALFD